jgi:septum formation protein
MMLHLPDRELILASSSATRRKILRDSGIDHKAVAAGVDEDSLKEAARAQDFSTRDAATMLAEMKAVKISNRSPGAYVIGSDQILELDGRWFSKPENKNEAVSHLTEMSGKTHSLITAGVIYRDGERIWHHVEIPKISIRTLSPAEINDYLEQMEKKTDYTSGVYMMENLGAQIISRVDGCPYAVLGLPLLQMLDFLRGHGLTLKRAS